MRRGTRKLLALLLVIVSGVYFLAHTGRVQAPSFIDTEKTQKYAAQFVSPKAFSSSEDSRLGNKAFVTIVTNTGDMRRDFRSILPVLSAGSLTTPSIPTRTLLFWDTLSQTS